MVSAYNEKIEYTSEQKKCLEYSGDKTLLVKGYAGAGKSVFVQGMALKCLRDFPDKSVAIFTLCHTLTSATNDVMKRNCSEDEYDRLEVRTLVKYLFEVYKAMGGKSAIVYDKVRARLIKEALGEHKKKFGEHRFQKLDIDFWCDEIDWMKGMDVTANDMQYYLTLPRKGRGGEVRMSKVDRVEAFRIFFQYERLLHSKHLIDWEDVPIYISRHIKDIPNDKVFDYVLLDEAQDFSLATIRAVRGLFRRNMYIGMDANQRIYSRHWTPKQVPLQTITKNLTKSLRTTVQIDALAESLRVHNDKSLDEDDKSLRAIPEKTGNIPVICRCKSIDEEKQYVTDIVKQYLKKYENKISIGIITSLNDYVDTFSSWMTDANIYHEEVSKDSTFSMSTKGVKIANLYNAKGLEFDVVIIPCFVEGVYPYRIRSDNTDTIEELLVKYRNFAYVSMTRAKKMLYITFSGDNGSRFIDEIDAKLYEKAGLDFDIKVGSNVKLPPMYKKIISEDTSLEDVSAIGGLKEFFESKGLKVVDKRENKGYLWVLGKKEEISDIVKEAQSKYKAGGVYTDGQGQYDKYGPAWKTRCKR